MRRTMASALFLLVAVAVMAASNGKAERNSTVKEIADTLSAIPGAPGTNTDLRNIIFKRRLDSIQKTVPLPYNQYVQQYIDIYMSRQNQIGKMLGLSNYYFPIYEKIFRENGIPEEIKFLSVVESALDPNAISRTGATGLWQFMYTTAIGYRLKIDSYTDERRDPVAASYAAAMYLKDAFAEFGDWLLAIASYNCGRGAVTRAIEKADGIRDFWAIRDYLPLETRNYIPAFIATTYIMKNYAEHRIAPVASDLPAETDIIQVNRLVSLAGISKATGIDVKQLAVLNPSYTKQVINGTPDSPKQLVIAELNQAMYNELYNALNSYEEEPKIIQASTRHTSKKKNTPSYHKVKKGENLSVIALRYHVEVQDLKVWNKLKNQLIKPGQLLKVSSGKNV